MQYSQDLETDFDVENQSPLKSLFLLTLIPIQIVILPHTTWQMKSKTNWTNSRCQGMTLQHTMNPMSGQWPSFFSLPAKWFLTGATTKVCGLAPDSMFSSAPSLSLPSYSPRLHSFSLWYLVTDRQEVLRGSGWLSRSDERKALLVAGRLSVCICVICVCVCVRACVWVWWSGGACLCAYIARRFEPRCLPPARWNCHQNMKASKHQTGPLIVLVCVHVCVCVCVWRGGVWYHVHMLVCRFMIVGVCIIRPAWICVPRHVMSCVLYMS